MINDSVMNAIDAMADLCMVEEQENGILAVREMLGEFDESEWCCMTTTERNEWLRQYMRG